MELFLPETTGSLFYIHRDQHWQAKEAVEGARMARIKTEVYPGNINQEVFWLANIGHKLSSLHKRDVYDAQKNRMVDTGSTLADPRGKIFNELFTEQHERILIESSGGSSALRSFFSRFSYELHIAQSNFENTDPVADEREIFDMIPEPFEVGTHYKEPRFNNRETDSEELRQQRIEWLNKFNPMRLATSALLLFDRNEFRKFVALTMPDHEGLEEIVHYIELQLYGRETRKKRILHAFTGDVLLNATGEHKRSTTSKRKRKVLDQNSGPSTISELFNTEDDQGTDRLTDQTDYSAHNQH